MARFRFSNSGYKQYNSGSGWKFTHRTVAEKTLGNSIHKVIMYITSMVTNSTIDHPIYRLCLLQTTLNNTSKEELWITVLLSSAGSAGFFYCLNKAFNLYD